MFLQSIDILDVDLCVQQPGKFIAHTRASADLGEVLPYLNAMFRRSDYSHEAGSIRFYHEKIEFTIIGNQVNVAKFVNRTELHELLDWFQDLVNDTYESRAELTPKHDTRKPVPVLSIYAMLPKTNCQKCSEKSCMAFAAKLHKLEVDIEDCEPLLGRDYAESKRKLESAFA